MQFEMEHFTIELNDKWSVLDFNYVCETQIDEKLRMLASPVERAVWTLQIAELQGDQSLL